MAMNTPVHPGAMMSTIWITTRSLCHGNVHPGPSFARTA